MNYTESGVDIDKEAAAISRMVSLLKETFSAREGKIGQVIDLGNHFANLVDLGDKALAVSTDGVGSKVLIAELLDDYSTIGIDMIAMNVNDIICTGAEPIALVDYYAVEEVNEKRASQLAEGMQKGAIEAGIAIIGGETATLPDIIKGAKPKAGFDIAGTALGVVEKNRIITGEGVNHEDLVVGLASSGVHSNGLTLARKVLDLNDKKILRTLLTPTRIYVKPVLEVINKCNVHGLAHITGGGILNIGRLNPTYGVDISEPRKPPEIFKKIQKKADVTDEEMYRTFNMGTGFVLVLPESEVDDAKMILSDFDPKVIGSIIETEGVYLRGERV